MTENTTKMLKLYRTSVDDHPARIRILVDEMEARLHAGWKAEDLHSAIECAEAIMNDPKLRNRLDDLE